jgi:hypothetical protein
MQRYTVYLYLETALHVSVGTSTHHQKRIQLYVQHLVFATPLLLPAAIVEDLELQSRSNSSKIAAGWQEVMGRVVLQIHRDVCQAYTNFLPNVPIMQLPFILRMF